MAATARQHHPLARWFAHQQKVSARHLSLHNLVFGTDMLRYLFYRTRYLIAVALFRIALHITEFALLVYTLPTLAVHAMLFRLSAVMIESGWWGVTDAMRHRIRFLRKRQTPAAVQREILGWLTLSVMVAGGVMAATAFMCWWTRYYHSPPFTALLLAMGLQTSVRIISRTFYFGAYAIQRVFLPIEFIIGLEIVMLLLGAAFYPYLGEWNIALCLFLSTCAVAAVSYRYVRQVTDFLRITPPRLFSLRAFAQAFRHHRLRLLVLPAAAALFMRLHDVLLIALVQYLAHKSHPMMQLLFALYLIMPFLRSAMNWAQVMYFDLSKYHLDRFARFRTTLERIGIGYSLLLGVLFAFLSAIIIEMFAASVFTATIALIAPYMLTSAALGFVLISLFARRRYLTVILLCAIQYTVLLVLLFWVPAEMAVVDAMMFSLTIPLMLGWVLLRCRWQPPQEPIESYLPWAGAVCRSRNATAIARLAFHPAAPRSSPMDTARDIAQAMDDDVLLCASERSLLVALPGADEKALRETLLDFGGGYVTRIDIAVGADGEEAYRRAIAEGVVQVADDGGEPLPEEIAHAFRELFPTGIVQVPMRKNRKLIAATTSAERRAILHEARRGSGERRKASRRWFITSAYVTPYLSMIFLVPREDTNEATRQAWQQLLDRFNRSIFHKKYATPSA